MRLRPMPWLGAIVAATALSMSGLIAVDAGDAKPSKARPSRSLSEHVALPLSGRGLVDELEVSVKAATGGIGTLRIRTTNDAQLPAGIRAAAITAPRISKRRRATFKVYVAVNNPSGPPSGNPAPANALDFTVYTRRGTVLSGVHLLTFDCEHLKTAGELIDEGVMNGSYTVVPLRPKTEQPSPGEEVFDRSAFARGEELGCLPGVVETPDPGND